MSCASLLEIALEICLARGGSRGVNRATSVASRSDRTGIAALMMATRRPTRHASRRGGRCSQAGCPGSRLGTAGVLLDVRVERKSAACGGADDGSVAEGLGKGDSRWCAGTDALTTAPQRTVAPTDDHHVLQLKDMGSKVAVTRPVIEDERERAVVDPGEPSDLHEAGFQPLVESGRWGWLHQRLQHLCGNCQHDDRSRQALSSKGPRRHCRATVAGVDVNCLQRSAGDRELALRRRYRHVAAVVVRRSDRLSQRRPRLENGHRAARSVAEIDAGRTT